MVTIYSDNTIIICPAFKIKRKVHYCVKCDFENGHLISENGSYVNCAYTESSKDPKKSVFPLQDKEREDWGVHERHCCPKHGCKYGDEECPVVLGLTEKHNTHCEMCEDEYNDPEPLALLMAWRKHESIENTRSYYESWMEEHHILKQLNIDPKVIRERGIEEGWWKKK